MVSFLILHSWWTRWALKHSKRYKYACRLTFRWPIQWELQVQVLSTITVPLRWDLSCPPVMWIFYSSTIIVRKKRLRERWDNSGFNCMKCIFRRRWTSWRERVTWTERRHRIRRRSRSSTPLYKLLHWYYYSSPTSILSSVVNKHLLSVRWIRETRGHPRL